MTQPSVVFVEGDLDSTVASEFEITGKETGIAVDIETSGLSPKESRIDVVSVAIPNQVVVIGVVENQTPHVLGNLLNNGSILKIFHHALFDLAFVSEKWAYLVEPVFCTKVAARIAAIHRNPTLQFLVSRLLGVELDKSQRLSDWSARPLSESQLRYAAADVVHLHALWQQLVWRLSDVGRSDLFERCMDFLNARVELHQLGLDDVFAYEIPEP